MSTKRLVGDAMVTIAMVNPWKDLASLPTDVPAMILQLLQLCVAWVWTTQIRLSWICRIVVDDISQHDTTIQTFSGSICIHLRLKHKLKIIVFRVANVPTQSAQASCFQATSSEC